jgi:transposase
LGINSNILSRWIREAAENIEHAFRGNGTLTKEQLEIRQLREEVRRLTMEKEILKKATVFFAKEAK